MTNNKQLVEALVRSDFSAFVEKSFEVLHPGQTYHRGRHIDAIGWHLIRCLKGGLKRLIITMPPRHLKSHCASVAFPCFVLGHNPSVNIVTASYSDDLAKAFSRQRRTLMGSTPYRRLFPSLSNRLGKCTESEVELVGGGGCLATSVRGTLTGRGGSFLIIDDPIKASDANSEAERSFVNSWYKETVYSRLDNKNDGVIVLVMQRVHEDDLVGHLLDLDDWTVLDLPAIAEDHQKIQCGPHDVYAREPGDVLQPERESYETLMQIKKTIGSRNFAAQYQQAPVPAEGNMIQRSWLRDRPGTMPRTEFDQIFQSWDTATETGDGNSYSACVTLGQIGADYHVLDVLRGRYDYPTLRRLVVSHAKAWAPHRILIEKASSGLSLLQDLHNRVGLNLIPVRPEKDKVTRVAQVSAIIEAGHLYLPKEAGWLAEFVREILAFPGGKFDDQVDALSQALKHPSSRPLPEVRARVFLSGLGSFGNSRSPSYFERTGADLPF